MLVTCTSDSRLLSLHSKMTTNQKEITKGTLITKLILIISSNFRTFFKKFFLNQIKKSPTPTNRIIKNKPSKLVGAGSQLLATRASVHYATLNKKARLLFFVRWLSAKSKNKYQVGLPWGTPISWSSWSRYLSADNQ